MKMKDQIARHENAGHENVGHENAGQENVVSTLFLQLCSFILTFQCFFSD